MDMIDATWRTSSYSGSNGGECVEVAGHPADSVLVRDTRDKSGPVLIFGHAVWRRFAAEVKGQR